MNAKKLVASALTCSMILSNSLPLFASEEYPTSTTNKDDVITIEKSATWDGETAPDADFFATVTLKASGIQNVVEELVTTKPVDIGIVLDESGSMAACLNPSHAGNYPMTYATDLKITNQTVADQLKSKGKDRQKFVIFFTDGDPDMSAEDLTAENLDKALKASQSLYSANNHMYGVFLNRDKADIGKMNRLVNAMNLNQPDSTKSSSYVSVVNSGTFAEYIGSDLESVFDSILTNIEKWSKSTMIISLEDTISPYFTIDREKLEGTEGEDWKIEATEDGLEKITFYANVDGFTEFDQLEKKIPVVLKEKYRYTTAYYPTNEGDAVCIYSDLDGKEVSIGTATPYLPVDNAPKVVKDILRVNEAEAQNGDMVTVGDVIEYQIGYENKTKENTKVTITDALPVGTEFVAADFGGEFVDGSIIWNFDDVEPGFEGIVTFQVKVTVNAESRIDNVATVTIGENTFTTNMISNPLIKKSIVSVNDAEGGEETVLMVGDKITYSIAYSNISEEPVDIMITDMVPKGTKFVEASDGGVLDGDAVAWTLLQVEPGASGSVTMTVEVTEDAVE